MAKEHKNREEHHAEHHEARHEIHHEKKSKINPWMISTIIIGIIAIVFIILMVTRGIGSGVSQSAAADKTVSLLTKLFGTQVTLTSAETNNSLYYITVGVQGQSQTFVTTKDFQFIRPEASPSWTKVSDLEAYTSGSNTNNNTQITTPAEVPKSDKPTIELFVMSYCPYGTQAQKGILPVVNLLKDKIDFKIRFVNYIMHAQKEIDENTVQYCIQKEQAGKFNTYLSCFLEAGNQSNCLTKTGIDKTKLNACTKAADTQFHISENAASATSSYPRYAVDEELNTQYGVQGSPTLVINGIEASSARDSASYLKTICSTFNTAPSECSQTLSSTSPDPGFGTTSSGSATGSATCG